jgi:hypothetical protein
MTWSVRSQHTQHTNTPTAYRRLFLGTKGSVVFSSFLMKWSRTVVVVVIVVVAHAIDSSCVDVGVSSAAFDPSSRLRRLLSHHSHQTRLFRQQLHPRQLFLILRL